MLILNLLMNPIRAKLIFVLIIINGTVLPAFQIKKFNCLGR